VCLRILYGSQNKQLLFPITVLNWHVFITETESVYCAVRAECLIIFQGDFRRLVRRAIAQAVSRRPLTLEAWVEFQVGPCEICGGQSGTGTGFATLVFPCQYNSINAPYPSSSSCCCYQKNKRANPRNPPTRSALSEIEEHWKEKYLVCKGLTALVISAFHRVFLFPVKAPHYLCAVHLKQILTLCFIINFRVAFCVWTAKVTYSETWKLLAWMHAWPLLLYLQSGFCFCLSMLFCERACAEVSTQDPGLVRLVAFLTDQVIPFSGVLCWEPYSHLSGQELMHKGLQLDRILSRPPPPPISNITVSSTSGSSKRSVHCVPISRVSIHATRTSHIFLPDLMTQIIFCEEYNKLWSTPLCNFLD
jgi:hypothetical protein